MDIYSRSYGAVEESGRDARPTPPPDYNGNLYRDPPKAPEPAPKKENEEKNIPPRKEPSEREQNLSVFHSVLEKISAEDLILFILILSILFGDAEENGTVLAVILAILLT